MTDSCYLMREFKESIFLPYRLSASKARGGFADQNAMGYVVFLKISTPEIQNCIGIYRTKECIVVQRRDKCGADAMTN